MEHKILKRLVRVGKKKIARLDRHSPGKLLDRHLLSMALNTWRAMCNVSEVHNSWYLMDPPSGASFSWDEEQDFVSLSSLSECQPNLDPPLLPRSPQKRILEASVSSSPSTSPCRIAEERQGCLLNFPRLPSVG
ncbi:hypothetical protein AHF37_10240 [Paragonimus kellicotti]|nr:hypothetical protein AHF37_10240 [Paragonimus kellicotti]